MTTTNMTFDNFLDQFNIGYNGYENQFTRKGLSWLYTFLQKKNLLQQVSVKEICNKYSEMDTDTLQAHHDINNIRDLRENTTVIAHDKYTVLFEQF